MNLISKQKNQGFYFFKGVFQTCWETFEVIKLYTFKNVFPQEIQITSGILVHAKSNYYEL